MTEVVLPRVAELFGASVRVGAVAVRDRCDELLPQELESLGTAADVRRREFSSGRVLVRELLTSLGAPRVPLLGAEDGLPLWPDGFTASISHKRTACVAVASRTQGARLLGVDLEDAQPLPERLWERVCRPREREWLAGRGDEERGLWARAIFSAKECTYKCLYPTIGVVLNFRDVELEFASLAESGAFRARVLREVPGDFPETLVGTYRIEPAWVTTGMALT